MVCLLQRYFSEIIKVLLIYKDLYAGDPLFGNDYQYSNVKMVVLNQNVTCTVSCGSGSDVTTVFGNQQNNSFQ
jgi:hypothetical protein